MKEGAIKQNKRFSLRSDFMKNIIASLIIFPVFFFILSSATGLNTTQSEIGTDLLNNTIESTDNQTYNSGNATNISESDIGTDALNDDIESQISEIQAFTFGSLHVFDSSYNPIFCLITIYDMDGIIKISDFTDNITINTINPGSHLYIESQEKNVIADFSIESDSFDPVIRLENYDGSNPIGDYNPPGLPLTFVSIAADNLSSSNIQLTINYLDDGKINASNLRIFKYVETPAYNEWVELPTSVDEINKAVSAETDSGTIFTVSVLDDTSNSNITIGNISVLDSIGVPQPVEIELFGQKGIIEESTGVLSIDEVPQGSHLLIYSTEMNMSLDFILNTDSPNPVILLEDFAVDNPAGDYSPPGMPLKYMMINAENLGYSSVNLTIRYPAMPKNIGLFRLTETFANEWEELSTVIDKTNSTISTSLNSLSIFALSKKPGKDLNILDIDNRPLTVNLKTYNQEKVLQKSKRGYILSSDEMPEVGYIEIDALAEKEVAVTLKTAEILGDDIILENFGKHNPKNVNPNRASIKFLEIHAGSKKYDRAEIEIKYSDEEIVSFDESKLQIAHYIDGEWISLESIVDTENNIVWATTDSFSTFALIYNGTSVNTKKSIYQPGETVEIVIVVLDSAGAPVSDASIMMNVTTSNGSTKYFSANTGSIRETSDPGVYEAAYVAGMEGRFNISCIAIIEGNESRFDTYFMVKIVYDFDIVRHAQSKIDPIKVKKFDVTIDIISYTDADTITIWEYMPADFEVYTDASVVEADNLKVLTWQRGLVNNRTSVNYSYSVPMEWPKLYQLGPVEIDYGNETFMEARPWWVAVDPEMIVNGDFSTGTGTDADNWTESYDGQATAEWDNTGENMYMHISSSGSGTYGNGYADQIFTYNLGTPPSSAYLDFDWYRDVNSGDADVFVQLKKPGSGNFDTLWSNTSAGDQTWTTVSDLDITSNFTASGDYTFRLYAILSRDTGTGTYARVRWDNVSLNITGEGVICSAPNITNVASSGVTRTQAHITWDTNQSDADNRVKYSIYPDLSDYNWSTWDNNTDSVHIQLTGLSPSAKYYYSAYTYNGTNNSLYSNSSIYNFTTAGNATAQGNVKDKNGDDLDCTITVYDEDGTVLKIINGNSFNFDDVPIGGYILFDALSSKNVSAKFKINGNSSDSTIILDDYGLNNPESTISPGNPVKYVNVSAVNVSYEYVEVKIYCSDADLGNRNENDLTIYHHKNGAWENLPTTVNAANNTFTAQTSSLSTLSVGEPNKLLVFTDKQVYRDELYEFDTLDILTTDNIDDLGVSVYVMVLDDEGNINTTGLSFNGTLEDVELQDHQASSSVHHTITYNPSGYGYDNITLGTFTDNGISPDAVAGDGIFTSYTDVDELPASITQQHLLINITVNETTSGINETVQVLFTRGGCFHTSYTGNKPTAHGQHVVSNTDQTACVVCHWGYEHYLGNHKTVMSPVDVSNLGGGQTWNYLTGDDTGTTTTTAAWSELGDSHYCYTCHFSGTTGNGAWDFTTDNITDRPSCNNASSVAGADCHDVTVIEGASLTDIDWKWKSVGAGNITSHNHTDTSPAVVSCELCHKNWHNNKLPNSSAEINDQCTICHSSTGPTRSENYTHDSTSTNCKACHLNTDQVMDPHLIAEAGIPNANCSECHDLGGQSLNLIDYNTFNKSDYVHNQLNITAGKYPLNYNATTGPATRPADDRICWGCHGEDDNEDGLANFSEQPAEHHPNRTYNPRTCEECHQNESSPWGAPQNVAHSNNSTDVQTPGAPHCYDCHGQTVMYNQSHQDTDYTTSYKDTVAAHYGTGFPALEALRSSDEYCTEYCHQNTSSPFKDIFVDMGDMQRPKHSSAATRPENQTCVDVQCHAAEALHSSEMKKPTLESGTFGNDNCTASTCHNSGDYQNHSGILNCTSCHMDNIGSNIHPIKYLQNDGETFSQVNNTAADCNLCHKETLADAKLTQWGLNPAKVGTQQHSEDTKNGSKWNKTSEPYWTYVPQTITFATGWKNNSERGFITNFENLTWTNDSATRISENTTEDSYVGHFPGNNEFTSNADGWSQSGTGTGIWSSTEGNPTGALTVYTNTLGLSVDHRWNTSFTYPKSTEVAEALIKLDSKFITTTRLNTGALKEINVSIDDNSGNVTDVYNRTLPGTPEPDWIESGEISISNPDTVFWKSGDYTLSIRTRFTTENRPPRYPTPDVRVGYDNIYLNVSEVDYKKYNFTLYINNTPESDRYELIMGYQTHIEPAGLYVLNNTVFEHKATLASGALTKLVVPLSDQEYNNGNITLLINDSTGPGEFDVHADYLEIQYMFVRSYRWVNDKPVHFPCEYCHEPDQHYENALGMPDYYKGNNYEGQEVNDTNNWCASCHYQGYQNTDKNYTDTVNAFLDHNLAVPPEITGHSVYGVNDTIDPDYRNHSNLDSYNDSTCWSCHRGALPLGVNSTVFVHHVTSGHIPKNVSITEITTNKTDYSTNEMVEINITVDNSGDENVTGDLNVSIRLQDGTVLNNTELYPDILILAGENNSTTTLWYTTTTPPGNYIAYAQFDYINQTRPENITNQTTFNITGIGATVQTNKSQYRPDSIINFTGTTYNLTSLVGGVDVNISVYYPNDTLSGWVNTTSDGSGDYTALYNIGSTYPVGTYSVNVQAYKDGISSINSTTFFVLDLLVNTTTDRSTYGAGGTVYITVNATYTNATTANNSQVNLTIKDPDDAVINETSGTIDGEGFYYYQYTLSTGAAEGTYSIIADITDPEGYNRSGTTTFNVVLREATLDVEPSITVMWPNQTKVFTLTVENTGVSDIISGSVNLTSEGLNFTIQNQSSLDFADLAVGSTASFNFNVTANTSVQLGIYTLYATLLFDGLELQQDIYIKVIPEPEIFVRTVTEKAVYLLDPELWITQASDYGVWPSSGYPRNVTINTMVIDQYGRIIPNERYPDIPTVTYYVHNGSSGAPIISSGIMDKTRTGFYNKTIEINETTGNTDYLVYVNVTGLGKEVSGSTTFTVGRWGCDSCHNYGGDHDWDTNQTGKEGSVLGGANSGTTYFDITILTNGSWTHSSPHAATTTHESLDFKCGGTCHSASVECTECHINYLLGQHSNVGVGTPPSTSCSNSSCHGHLTDSLDGNPGNVANRYPNCSASPCHPISYIDNFTITSQEEPIDTVPQWLNTTTGMPRDIAVHPNPDNAIVNCSFCHNSFHNIYDEPDTLTCGDCHNESISYKLHNGTTTPSSTSANCTDCHNFSSSHQIDIHNTITPACSECHAEVNHSSYNSTGVNCLECHNDRLLNYSGSVLDNGTYMANTSIHSKDYLLPDCTACHLGYSNHSSYDIYGVYCTSCHNNATLDYNSIRNLLFNGTIYNTTYNTNTSIHTMTNIEMIPNCTDCHGSPQYQTHLGNQTNVSSGLAANCTQCHDNQTLNYTGTILPVQGNYNTGSEIHTTSRTLMLPDQTLEYNDNCGKCHYQIYDSGYDLHSGGSYCSACHYGDYMEYQGTFEDKPIEHSENITRLSCTECHFNWTKMNTSINKPVYYVNSTMFNAGVHSLQTGIQCRSCHTSAHPPPEYSWKWCECCHSYQSEPLNETDRHNITSDPWNYKVDGDSVVNITDCTSCHNATRYNTSKETFNRVSGKDCRYCHTFPDQTYN